MINNVFLDSFNIHPYVAHFNEKNTVDICEYNNSVLLDLFDTLSSICYTDFYTSRDENKHNRLSVVIPVQNYSQMLSIQAELTEVVNFMTGDLWDIQFVKSSDRKMISFNPRLELINSFQTVMMFSGGIDSFCGGIREINNQKSTLFVNVINNREESNISRKSFEKWFSSQNNHLVQIERIKLNNLRSHYTQRTRSLFFISVGLIYCDYYNVDTLKIYENGIVSLNPNVTYSRKMTKTTHPRTFFLINNLLSKIDVRIKISNPFCFSTKGDLIASLTHEQLVYLNSTKTCSKSMSNPHFKGKRNAVCHCGICLSCVFRQISFVEKSNYDVSYYLGAKYNSKELVNKIVREKHNDYNNITPNDIDYLYFEKNSLVLYYQRMLEIINKSEIINYLNVKSEYFEEDNYRELFVEMFIRFGDEIKYYLERLV